jgi:hypothetical protein
MSMTAELEAAERKLAAMVNRRYAEEESERRADKAERVRADDLRCRDLAAEYQPDYQAFGVTPPMPRADEWASDFERRLVRGLQRRLSPRSDYADSTMLDGLSPKTFDNIAKMVRDEAAREAAQPSLENLPASVYDPRARIERTDSDTGERKIEFRARESFIRELSSPGRKVAMFLTDRGPVVMTPR